MPSYVCIYVYVCIGMYVFIYVVVAHISQHTCEIRWQVAGVNYLLPLRVSWESSLSRDSGLAANAYTRCGVSPVLYCGFDLISLMI